MLEKLRRLYRRLRGRCSICRGRIPCEYEAPEPSLFFTKQGGKEWGPRKEDPGWNDLTDVQKAFYEGYDSGYNSAKISERPNQ